MIKTTSISLILMFSSLVYLDSSSAALEQIKQSNNLSQLVRSNASDFWGWAKRFDPSKTPTKQNTAISWMQHEGYVLGDSHIGNFSVRESTFKDGDSRLTYRPVDFDDVGRGPFVLDLVRLAVASKAVDPGVNIKELAKAYIKGLEIGPAPVIPKRVSKALSLSSSKVAREDRKEIESHLKNGVLDFKEGRLVEVEDDLFFTMTQMFYPDAEVLSMGLRLLKRGGSLDADRIWVLIGSDKDKKIIEYKEIIESSVSSYMQQQAPNLMIRPIFRYFLPDLALNEHLIVRHGDQFFLVKEKKASLIDTNFNIDKKKERKEFLELSNFTAYNLGLVHGRQSSSRGLLRDLYKKGVKDLIEVVDSLSSVYLESVEKDFMDFKIK